MISLIALILGLSAHFLVKHRLDAFTFDDLQYFRKVDLHIMLVSLIDLGIVGLFGSEFLLWAVS